MNDLENFTTILDQLDGVAIVDQDCRYIYANRGWERHMGVPIEKMKGHSALDFVPDSHLKEAMEQKKSIIAQPIVRNGMNMFSSYIPLFKGDDVIGCFIQIVFGNIDEALYFSRIVGQIKEELSYYKNAFLDLQESMSGYSLDHIIGKSDAVCKMKEKIRKAAQSRSTVLIIGETGSGKEMVAQSIHNLSKRSSGPFIKINCAAIPAELAESEFFGYEYGAFTGARKNGKKGLFEMADQGSIFLDEVNQMSYYIQPKILRALQESEVTRVGGSQTFGFDARIIAASNQPLNQLVLKNEFRQDLYYRLNVVRIEVPALRERIEDISVLTEHIIHKLNHQLGFCVEGVCNDVIDYLQSYNWPGNIRELQNTIEQAMNIKSSGMLTMDCFESAQRDKSMQQLLARAGVGTLEERKRQLEKVIILETYEKYAHNKRKTAEELGISRPMLYQRLKEYKIEDE